MTIVKKTENNKIVVDLTGQDGNAFCLIKLASDLCKRLNRMGADYNYDIIYADMTKGDYENLVQLFDDYFGHLVILER